jgi:hypothetical protein
LLKAFSCCAAILLAGCNPDAIRDNDLRTAARTSAQIRFSAECGTLTVPDRAFLPIDITGDGRDAYVLSFARVVCEKTPSLWSAAHKTLFEVWTDDGGNPRMILEQRMAGFRHDYKSPTLITDQQGNSCPGTLGSETCRIVYRWDPTARDLVIVARQSMPADPLPVSGIMASGQRDNGSRTPR